MVLAKQSTPTVGDVKLGVTPLSNVWMMFVLPVPASPTTITALLSSSTFEVGIVVVFDVHPTLLSLYNLCLQSMVSSHAISCLYCTHQARYKMKLVSQAEGEEPQYQSQQQEHSQEATETVIGAAHDPSYRYLQPSYGAVLLAIFKKNAYVIRQNLNKYLLIYFSPLLILLLIMMLQAWANANLIWQRVDPPITEIPPIPRCYGQDCLTLAYAVNGEEEPYIEHTIAYLKKSNNLTDSDVKRWKMNPQQVLDKLQIVPNKTQAVVVFCTTGSWQVANTELPCYGEEYHLDSYTIIYNFTLFHRVPFFSSLKGSYPKDLTTVRLKRDLDFGIIDYFSNSTAELEITTADFPSKNSRFITGMNIFAQYGSFFIMIPYLVLMVMEGSQKLKQKQDRLRIGLNIVGVSHLQFYLAEVATYLVSVLAISLSFCLWGTVLGYKFWSNAVIWFDFVILSVNGFTLGILTFCITALVNNKNLGMSIIYGFVLYSIVMQWLFSGGYILELLYMDTASVTVKFFKYLFNAYPSFHFTKVFADVTRTADSHFDTLVNRYIEGRKFLYEDLFTQRSQTFEKPFPRSYTLPSCMESLFYMALTTILYVGVLALLDRYMESNRGYSQPICFGAARKRKNSSYGHHGDEEGREVMVRITNLQKTYGNKVHALRGVSEELYKGQIVSLLGENGAGKSTLINILIGALSQSKGQITVEGKNVRVDLVQIRKMCGVCPQFDILWEEMTALQHIELFSRIKGFPYGEEVVKKILQSVKLYQFRHGKVSTFSGGMRRRLSLAISLIGNPKLIILDEPTTGMDAKIRLQTWKIILQLRDPGRSMLITTHNMEEAQCLSDRILIMNKGRVAAKGTTIELKNAYGQGYLIRGKQKGSDEEVKFRCTEEELEGSLQRIKNMELDSWSLEQTTLEEVFLNVVNRY